MRSGGDREAIGVEMIAIAERARDLRLTVDAVDILGAELARRAAGGVNIPPGRRRWSHLREVAGHGLAPTRCHAHKGAMDLLRTVGEHLENVKSNRDQKVVCRVAHPISPGGEVVGLQGSGAPEGAIVKVMDMTRLQFRRAARVFDGVEDFKQRTGMPATAALEGRSAGGKVAPITDGRLCGFCIGDLPITRIGASDVIASDAEMGARDSEKNEAEPAMRRDTWTASVNPYQTGTLRTCADQIGQARTGAVAHAGSRAEVACYADF